MRVVVSSSKLYASINATAVLAPLIERELRAKTLGYIYSLSRSLDCMREFVVLVCDIIEVVLVCFSERVDEILRRHVSCRVG